MAVCEYCRASVVKDADAVKRPRQDVVGAGRLFADPDQHRGHPRRTPFHRRRPHPAALFEPASGTSGIVLFDDGSAGWLGDASGQYTLTLAQPDGGIRLPAFADITPGKSYPISGRPFHGQPTCAKPIASAARENCRFGWAQAGKRAWPTSAREREFLTLDYSDGDKPLLYTGFAVTLPDLKFQLLRDDEQIKASAGKYRGKRRVRSLCPSCGTAIRLPAGRDRPTWCAPHARRSSTPPAPQAQVLAKGEQVERRTMHAAAGRQRQNRRQADWHRDRRHGAQGRRRQRVDRIPDVQPTRRVLLAGRDRRRLVARHGARRTGRLARPTPRRCRSAWTRSPIAGSTTTRRR